MFLVHKASNHKEFFIDLWILTIYNSFRCFREAYLIGGSHPNEQLYSIQHFLQNNFMNMNYARLEAASILVVIFVGAFVLSGMCLARKKRNER